MSSSAPKHQDSPARLDARKIKEQLQREILMRNGHQVAKLWNALHEVEPKFVFPPAIQFDLCRILVSGGNPLEAITAFELLLKRHPHVPVSQAARLEAGRLCAPLPQYRPFAMECLRDFLAASPPVDQAAEAQQLLDQIQLAGFGVKPAPSAPKQSVASEKTPASPGDDQTPTGAIPFSEWAGSTPRPRVSGTPSPARKPVATSPEEAVLLLPPAPTPPAPFPLFSAPELPRQPSAPKPSPLSGIPVPPPLPGAYMPPSLPVFPPNGMPVLPSAPPATKEIAAENPAPVEIPPAFAVSDLLESSLELPPDIKTGADVLVSSSIIPDSIPSAPSAPLAPIAPIPPAVPAVSIAPGVLPAPPAPIAPVSLPVPLAPPVVPEPPVASVLPLPGQTPPIPAAPSVAPPAPEAQSAVPAQEKQRPITEDFEQGTRILEMEKFRREQAEREKARSYRKMLAESRFSVLFPPGKRIHFEETCELVARFLDVDVDLARRKLRSGKGLVLSDLSYDDMISFYRMLVDCRQHFVFVRQDAELTRGEALEEILAARHEEKWMRVTTLRAQFRIEWETPLLLSAGMVREIRGDDQPVGMADIYLRGSNRRHLRLFETTFNFRSWEVPDPSAPGRFRALLLDWKKLFPQAVVSHTIELLAKSDAAELQVFESRVEYERYNRWLLLSHFGDRVDPSTLHEDLPTLS